MRQITMDSIRAFRNGTRFTRGNMKVRHYRGGEEMTGKNTTGKEWENGEFTSQLRLHNNTIATLSNEGLTISTCGWNTVTTRERLNGLPNVHLIQRNFELILNGEAWDGRTIKI
jgi:hypothetical protein